SILARDTRTRRVSMTEPNVPAVRPTNTSKAVVILGAGSSADFGVPILREVFKEVHARQFLRNNAWLRTHLENIFWDPRGVNLEPSDQALTIEEMLTALHDWTAEPIAQTLSAPDVQTFKRTLFCLIKAALYDGKTTAGRHLNPLIAYCRNRFSRVTWA